VTEVKRVFEILDEALITIWRREGRYILCYFDAVSGRKIGIFDQEERKFVKEMPVDWVVTSAVFYGDELYAGKVNGYVIKLGEGKVVGRYGTFLRELVVHEDRLWALTTSDDLSYDTLIEVFDREEKPISRKDSEMVTWISHGYAQWKKGPRFTITRFDFTKARAEEEILRGLSKCGYHLGEQLEVVDDRIFTSGPGDRIVAYSMKKRKEKEIYKCKRGEVVMGFYLIEAGEYLNLLVGGNSGTLALVKVRKDLKKIKVKEIKTGTSLIRPLVAGDDSLIEAFGSGEELEWG